MYSLKYKRYVSLLEYNTINHVSLRDWSSHSKFLPSQTSWFNLDPSKFYILKDDDDEGFCDYSDQKDYMVGSLDGVDVFYEYDPLIRFAEKV